MSQEAGYSNYDNLLIQARGSAKHWIPRLCEALKKENPEMIVDDIRERVKKDCISIWQRDTITDALPVEYKNKRKQEAGRKGRQRQLEQADGTVITTENVPDSNRASLVPNLQSEQYYGADDSSIARLKSQLEEVREENRKLRQTTTLPELEEQLYDGRGIMDIREIPKINDKPRENFELLIERYNSIILDRIKTNERVPLSLYVISRTGLLVPIKIIISFKDKDAHIELNKNKLN